MKRQKSFSIRVSDDVEALMGTQEPVVALNLMGLSMLNNDDFMPEKSVFWVDGIVGSFACLLAGLSIKRIPGRDLLVEVAKYIASKRMEQPVFILGGGLKTPRLTKLMKFAPVQIDFPWINSSDDINNFFLENFCANSIVFIAIASPKQEWLARVIYEKKSAKCICIGGALNMLEGIEKRPPEIISKLGVEWLYRLQHEPRRRLKRLLDSLFKGLKSLFYAKNIRKLKY